MLALMRQRNFSLLWFAGLISLAGDWMLSVALPLYVYNLTESALATSGMMIARLVPMIAMGPIAGVFVDRWDRRNTMIICNLLRAPILLGLVFVDSASDLWLAYLVAFSTSTIAQFFSPAENALLPLLVSPDRLVPANSLNTLNNNLARLLGPPLGAGLAALYGLNGPAIADSASFLIAALLLALVISPEASKATKAAAERAGTFISRLLQACRNVLDELRAGFRLIVSNRTLRILFVLFTITSIGEGVMGVMFLVFVKDILRGGSPELGWFMSGQAVGGLAGALLIGAYGARLAAARLIGWGCLGLGIIDLAIFNYPNLTSGVAPVWPGVAFMIVVGVPAAAAVTGWGTMIQQEVEDAFRGRVFAALTTTIGLFNLVGALLAGIVGDRFGVITILNLQSSGYIIAGISALLLLVPVVHRSRAAVSGSVPVSAGSSD